MAEQIRNDEMIELLKPDFVTRDEFYRDGSRLSSAILATHRAFDGTQGAGGNLIEGWLADSRQVHGAGSSTVWTENNIAFANYATTTNGGPYVALDGVNQFFSIADAAWQEAGSEEIFTWRWVYSTDYTVNQTITAKFDRNLNQRSWRLWFSAGANRFFWTTNAGGAAGGDLNLSAATYGAPSTNTWYFVAGYYEAATLMRIWVGAATDDVLIYDSTVAFVPVAVLNTTAHLTCGAEWTPISYWKGRIGIGHTRFNVPSANINAYATRLFHLTRWFYQA